MGLIRSFVAEFDQIHPDSLVGGRTCFAATVGRFVWIARPSR